MSTLNPLKELRSHVARAGSMRKLAAEFGVSCAYISDVLSGKRTVGPALLDPMGLACEVRVVKLYKRKPATLGLERVVTYRRRKAATVSQNPN